MKQLKFKGLPDLEEYYLNEENQIRSVRRKVISNENLHLRRILEEIGQLICDYDEELLKQIRQVIMDECEEE